MDVNAPSLELKWNNGATVKSICAKRQGLGKQNEHNICGLKQ